MNFYLCKCADTMCMDSYQLIDPSDRLMVESFLACVFEKDCVKGNADTHTMSSEIASNGDTSDLLTVTTYSSYPWR